MCTLTHISKSCRVLSRNIFFMGKLQNYRACIYVCCVTHVHDCMYGVCIHTALAKEELLQSIEGGMQLYNIDTVSDIL